MSVLKNFIVKYDKTIVKALVIVVTLFIPALLLLPQLIESYTYNAYVSGTLSNYIESDNSLKFLRLFSFALIAIFIVYSLLRKYSLGEERHTNYNHKTKLWILVIMLVFPAIALHLINSHYENKNSIFIENKLKSIKQSVLDGKCSPAANKGIGYFTDVSSCGIVEGNLPGTIYLLKAGQYSTTSHKDGKSTTITEEKPNTLTYKNYLGSFCRDLTDSENPVYKEFTAVEVHGVNPLSDKFETASCEERKTVGQIQFMFK